MVALSSLYVPPMTPQLKAAMKSLGPQAQLAFGKSVAVDGSVEMSAIPASMDLVLEEIETPTTQLVGGQPISVMVTVGNRGRRYQASEDGPAKLVLRWDSPTGVGTPFGSQDLSTIAGGGSTDFVFDLTVPAGFKNDQVHVLYATVVVDPAVTELYGDNNQQSRRFGDLPVPQTIRSEIQPGTPWVQLSWDHIADARVAGVRVYAEDVAGQILPLGSSGVDGFLDLSAQFNAPRTYYLTSYSASGQESQRSDPLVASPTLAPAPPAIFSNGFE